jgi:hypothetical protein
MCWKFHFKHNFYFDFSMLRLTMRFQIKKTCVAQEILLILLLLIAYWEQNCTFCDSFNRS